MKKQLIWVFDSRKSVHSWWSYISCSPECKELTCMLDPLLYRWGIPPVVIRCVHLTMRRGVLQTWITAQSPTIVMVAILSRGRWVNNGEAQCFVKIFEKIDHVIIWQCTVFCSPGLSTCTKLVCIFHWIRMTCHWASSDWRLLQIWGSV